MFLKMQRFNPKPNTLRLYAKGKNGRQTQMGIRPTIQNETTKIREVHQDDSQRGLGTTESLIMAS